jgi:hypothetical protein
MVRLKVQVMKDAKLLDVVSLRLAMSLDGKTEDNRRLKILVEERV